VAARIAKTIKARIISGELSVGQYLPGVRELGREQGVSPETARRAMKMMEAEHWLSAHPGHGFKVTARGNDPEKSAPVAFVLTGKFGGDRWSVLCQHLMAAFYASAQDRGWSLLSVGTTGRSARDVVRQLRESRASGMLLDTPDARVIKAIRGLGMATVMVEEPAAGLDCVAQDNFGGAFRAAEYLAGRGHRRIGWFGSLEPTNASRERWGGAAAALRDSDARIAPEHALNAEGGAATDKLRKLLSGPDRPTGLLALWWPAAAAAMRTARELGLKPGTNLELVAWCSEEQLPEFAAVCPEGELPPTVTWSMRQLGEAALARLAERRRRPGAPAVRTNVEAKLLLPPGARRKEGRRGK
jgi:LacI family transcriptional regulator